MFNGETSGVAGHTLLLKTERDQIREKGLETC